MSGFCKNCKMTYDGIKCPICYNKKHSPSKLLISGVVLLCVVIISGSLMYLDVITINHISVDQTLQDIPSSIRKVQSQLPPIPELQKELERAIPEIKKELPKIQEQITSPNKPELDISEIESLVHKKVNEQRSLHGLSTLDYDSQISDIARMHSYDMATNDYFEHVSPSGDGPSDRGSPYGYHICGNTDVIAIQNRYDELLVEYEAYPKTLDPVRYDQAMLLYDQLNELSQQLAYHSDNNQLFGGLAENIFQGWTYNSVTYVGAVSIYDWIDDDTIAQQAVDGWMDSPGHRENILSGYHSEGIGIAITPEGKVYVTQNFC
jgi:uncharacterized protein YkwD